MDIRPKLEKIIDTRGLSDTRLAELWENWRKKGRVNVFSIWHDNDSIRLETNHSEFTSLERIMIVGATYFIDQGKVMELKQILASLQTKLQEVS
jgi:hypothetical protein